MNTIGKMVSANDRFIYKRGSSGIHVFLKYNLESCNVIWNQIEHVDCEILWYRRFQKLGSEGI